MFGKAVAFVLVLTVALLVFLALSVFSLFAVDPRAVPEKVAAGKRVWQRYGCVECHTVLGNGGYNGPDLTHIAAVRRRQDLEDFLTRPQPMRPHARRRHPPVKPEEVKALVAYLEFLDRLQVKGWPPRPLEVRLSLPQK